MGNLYTIGYSKIDSKKFISFLNKYGINYVLDVRSTPYSKHSKEYNRELIKDKLSRMNINYSYMGNVLGGRIKDEGILDFDNIIDYKKLEKKEYYIKGINNILLGLNRDNNIVIMCAEANPIDCHRGILISKTLTDRGIEVKHIMNDGSLETQSDLEMQMLNKYFPDRRQTSIFDTELNEHDLIEKCYILRNKDIAYRETEDNN